MTFNEINSAFHFPALSQGLVKSNGAGEYQNIFQAWHNQFVASSKAVKIGHELRSDIQIGCMIIYATTYSIDANPVNQAATMIQNQEFNFSARMSKYVENTLHTQRVPIKNMESIRKN